MFGYSSGPVYVPVNSIGNPEQLQQRVGPLLGVEPTH